MHQHFNQTKFLPSKMIKYHILKISNTRTTLNSSHAIRAMFKLSFAKTRPSTPTNNALRNSSLTCRDP